MISTTVGRPQCGIVHDNPETHQQQIIAVLNVEMVSDAARNGINPSFPLSVASACYLVPTFLINVALFGELDQGIALYWKEHWTRVVALVLVVFAVIMTYK